MKGWLWFFVLATIIVCWYVFYPLEHSVPNNSAANYEDEVERYLKSNSMYEAKWFELKWQGKKVGFINEQWKAAKGTISWHQRLKISGTGRGLKMTTIQDEHLQFSSHSPHQLLSGYSHKISFQGSMETEQWSRFKIEQHTLIVSKNGYFQKRSYPQSYTISQHLFPALVGKLPTSENRYQVKLWDMDVLVAADYLFEHYIEDSKQISWISRKSDERWQSIWYYNTAGNLTGRSLVSSPVSRIDKVSKPLISYNLSSREVAEPLDSNHQFNQNEYIKIDSPLGNISRISKLELELSGHNKIVTQQAESGGVLHIGASMEIKSRGEEIQMFLKSSRRYPKLAQLDTILRSLYQAESGTREKVTALVNFVSEFVEDGVVLTQSSVESILNNPVGDCTEHALLFVALARSSGIPAREVNGLLYLGDKKQQFQAHVWAEVFIDNQWMAVDPSWDRIKLDPGYIQINNGSSSDSSIETSHLATSGKKFHLKSIHYL